ncbi:hypothetical protein [Azospirillum sp. B4]|uniref:hypothetical protein n=1 Tax=Azospirillum sp. B4 TaxID=95605 RepID=UPI0011DD0781|nr:hypothetical protein [Azospirillum sp. B4]
MNHSPPRRSVPLPHGEDEEFHRQAKELVASLEAAQAELDRDGPVSRDELASMLRELGREWGLDDDVDEAAKKGPVPNP